MAPITNLSVESSDQFATPEMDEAIARLAAEDPELALVLLAQRQAAQAEEDRVISQTETEIVTASDAFEDFANLSVEQQNSYAEAMFVNGLGDGLGIKQLRIYTNL